MISFSFKIQKKRELNTALGVGRCLNIPASVNLCVSEMKKRNAELRLMPSFCLVPSDTPIQKQSMTPVVSVCRRRNGYKLEDDSPTQHGSTAGAVESDNVRPGTGTDDPPPLPTSRCKPVPFCIGFLQQRSREKQAPPLY